MPRAWLGDASLPAGCRADYRHIFCCFTTLLRGGNRGGASALLSLLELPVQHAVLLPRMEE